MAIKFCRREAAIESRPPPDWPSCAQQSGSAGNAFKCSAPTLYRSQRRKRKALNTAEAAAGDSAVERRSRGAGCTPVDRTCCTCQLVVNINTHTHVCALRSAHAVDQQPPEAEPRRSCGTSGGPRWEKPAASPPKSGSLPQGSAVGSVQAATAARAAPACLQILRVKPAGVSQPLAVTPALCFGCNPLLSGSPECTFGFRALIFRECRTCCLSQ